MKEKKKKSRKEEERFRVAGRWAQLVPYSKSLSTVGFVTSLEFTTCMEPERTRARARSTSDRNKGDIQRTIKVLPVPEGQFSPSRRDSVGEWEKHRRMNKNVGTGADDKNNNNNDNSKNKNKSKTNKSQWAITSWNMVLRRVYGKYDEDRSGIPTVRFARVDRPCGSDYIHSSDDHRAQSEGALLQQYRDGDKK